MVKLKETDVVVPSDRLAVTTSGSEPMFGAPTPTPIKETSMFGLLSSLLGMERVAEKSPVPSGINDTVTISDEKAGINSESAETMKRSSSVIIPLISSNPFPVFEIMTIISSDTPSKTLPKSISVGSTTIVTIPVTFILVINSTTGDAGSLLAISSPAS